MSFFSHGIGRIVKAAAPVVIGAFNPALGAAVGAGLGTSGGGGIVGGLTGAAGGYFGGSALGGAYNGFVNGAGAGTLEGALSGASGGASNALGTLGSTLGIGGMSLDGAGKVLQAASLGSSLFGSNDQKNALAQQQIGSPSTAPFNPQRPEAMARPNGLSELASYSPEQERSALATKGLNTGLGADENSYYRNLIQRSLIGDGNKVNVSNPNFLMPVESQYFSRQGINTSDQLKFLQALHG